MLHPLHLMNRLIGPKTSLAAQVSSYVWLLFCIWYENNVTGFRTYLLLTGQSPNWIEIINAAKLQFFRGLIIHFSICRYLALVRLTFYYLSTSVKCLALKSEVKRKNKDLSKDLKFFAGFSCLWCIWKIRCLQFTLFKRLLELFNRKVLKLGHTPSYHPDNCFEIKWINKCLTVRKCKR